MEYMKFDVAISECKEYQIVELERAVDELFSHLGGIEKFVKPGQRVLLKCNLLMKKKPEEAVTTHPLLVETLVNRIQSIGAQAIIGDSPGGPFTQKALRGVYRVSGMEDVALRTGASLNWNTEGMDCSHPKGVILKNIHIAKFVKEVDVVISLSKLKTHGMTTYTGAVKNLFGVIPGLLKAEYHFKMPDIQDFSNMLVDIETYVTPTLSIIDGIMGMEGAGPSAGSPRKVGLLLASTHAHAIDYVACDIIGLKAGQVPTLQRAIERGIISPNMEEINILGIQRKEIQIEPFALPNTASVSFLKGRVPKFMEGFVNQLLQPKPVFIHDQCVGCGECAQNCPAKIIEMKEKKPYVDLSQCIRCFCCQELCPYKAIEIKRPWLGKKILTK